MNDSFNCLKVSVINSSCVDSFADYLKKEYEQEREQEQEQIKQEKFKQEQIAKEKEQLREQHEHEQEQLREQHEQVQVQVQEQEQEQEQEQVREKQKEQEQKEQEQLREKQKKQEQKEQEQLREKHEQKDQEQLREKHEQKDQEQLGEQEKKQTLIFLNKKSIEKDIRIKSYSINSLYLQNLYNTPYIKKMINVPIFGSRNIDLENIERIFNIIIDDIIITDINEKKEIINNYHEFFKFLKQENESLKSENIKKDKEIEYLKSENIKKDNEIKLTLDIIAKNLIPEKNKHLIRLKKHS